MMGRFNKIMELFFRQVVGRYYVGLAVGSVAVTLLAVAMIVEQWNINSDFQELLPSTSEAAIAMNEVGERVGSGSSLFVVIDSPDGDANLEFAGLYAEELRQVPEIALAHFHNEKSFFEDHRLLYVDVEDLEELHDRIRSRIRRERQQQNPLFVSLRREPRDEGNFIDTSEVEERYEELAHQDYKEYLVSDDGYALTIVVRFVETSTDLTATNQLLDRVRQIGEDLSPESFHPDMVLEFGGGLVHRQQEYTSIVDDIQTSAVFTIFALFLVIALYFRRLRAVALVLTPLVMGVLWTLALAFAFYGALTVISVFIFAILLGLGIDFSIHLLNGYDRERMEGRSPIDALVECYASVGKATVMGASTTFATFVVLSFAQFRGLSQFGQVAALGVVMTILAMLVVLPSLILTFQRLRPHEPKRQGKKEGLFAFDRYFNKKSLSRFSPGLLIAVVLLLGLAVWQVPNLEFEENFRRIGEVEPPWHQEEQIDERQESEIDAARQARRLARAIADDAVEVRRTIDEESFVPDREQMTTGAKYSTALRGQTSSTPTLLLLDDADDAARLYHHIADVLERGEMSSVSSVASIHAFLPGTPEEQAERLEVIAEIRQTLDDDLDFLSASQRERVDEMRALVEIEAITIYDLPEWAKRLFREAGPKAREPAEGEEFAFEYLIYVNEAIDHMVGAQARRFLGQVQDVTGEVGVDVRIGSQSFIYTAMLDEIKYDGTRMLGMALILVFLMLTFFFRSPLRASVALLPLTVGAIWMFGFAAWFGIKLDFFNVIILPVVIGIGIDDGVHFYHRYLDRGKGSILEVFRHVGSAVGMTTITSIIGFGGLAITDYAGLQSIGYLAITGLATAFLATVMVLPALLWLGERQNWTWILPDRDQSGSN